MQSAQYEMVGDFDLTNLDISKPKAKSQDDVTKDPRITHEMLTDFYENRVADGILQVKS